MEAPLVSVVIAAVNDPTCVSRCLEALTAQAGSPQLELLVVERSGGELRAALHERFPEARVLAALEPNLPRMRAQALRQARGGYIAVLADRFVPGSGWVQALMAARLAGHAVAGGPVENGAAAGWLDWAVYLCEYAPFMLPFPAGPAARLPANNVLYERSVAARVAAALESGPFDESSCGGAHVLGVTGLVEPGLVVTLVKTWRSLPALAARFHAGRAFAASRSAGWPGWKRWAYACGTPCLPALLFGRLLLVTARKRRHRARLIWAAPLVVALLASGAWGECLGALRGAGRSLERLG